MGDSGSLFIGFIVSALALGTSYHGETDLTVLAPLIILVIPIYDTLLVFTLRILRGLSPFLGSKDHFPLRLERRGWDRSRILNFTLLMGILFGTAAYFVTKVSILIALGIYLIVLILLGLFTRYIIKENVN